MKLSDLQTVTNVANDLRHYEHLRTLLDRNEILSVTIAGKYLDSDLVIQLKPAVRRILDDQITGISQQIAALGVSV